MTDPNTSSTITPPVAPAAPSQPADITSVLNQQTSAQVSAPRPTAYHSNVERADIGDDNIKTGDFEVYKGTAGRIDRLAILVPRDIVYGRVHYVDNEEKGGYMICDTRFARSGKNETVEKLAFCCEKLGMPKKRFAALVAHYTTDPTGRLLTPFSFILKVWRFNETTFDNLRSTNREMSLEEHDILVKCDDATYQKVTLTPCKESVVRMATFQEQYGAEVAGFIAGLQPRLDRTVGRKLEAREWAELLGAPGVGATVAGAADAPVADIAALLGQPIR